MSEKTKRQVKFELGEALETMITVPDRVVTLHYGDEGTVTGKLSDLPTEILGRMAAIGWKDSVISGTGMLKNLRDKFATATANLADRLAGNWALRSGGSAPAKKGGEIFAAYCEFRAKAAAKDKTECPSEDELRTIFYDKWPDRKSQMAVARNPEIAKIIAANKPKSDVTVDDLMG